MDFKVFSLRTEIVREDPRSARGGNALGAPEAKKRAGLSRSQRQLSHYVQAWTGLPINVLNDRKLFSRSAIAGKRRYRAGWIRVLIGWRRYRS